MTNRFRRLKPTPSMAVALTALTVALGGTSYAAVTLATHSVTGPKIAPGAVSLSKIKTHAVSQSRIRPGAVSPSKLSATVQKQLAATGGPTGPTGPVGPTGPRGTAVAYGTFTATGTPRADSTAGLGGLQVNHASAGVYCLSGISGTLANVVVSVDAAGAANGATAAATLHDRPDCAAAQIEVTTFRPVATGGAEAADEPFSLVLN